MSWVGKWIDLIYRVATGSWKTRLVLAPMVGAFFLSLIVLFFMLSLVADKFLHLPAVIFHPWNLVGNDNRKLTICDNRILTTPERS